MVEAVVESCSSGLGSVMGRHICASVVAAGPQPALGEAVTQSSRWSDLGHDVSILMVMIGPVGRCRGVEPRSKVSMMIMRPPQHGQGCEGVGGSLGSRASASTLWSQGIGTASSSRARAMLSAQDGLASRP
jgi:hypothetical protein